MIFRNCLVINYDELVDIHIEKNLIKDIKKNIVNNKNIKEIDLKGKLVSPGFIDMHTHIREPGQEHKETIKTATMAAAAGGYTLICAMPNTNPIMDNIDTIKEFYNKVESDAIVKVKTFGAITKNFNDELVDIKSLNDFVCGFSNDGVGVQTSNVMYQAMKNVKKSNSLISAHCEDESLLYGGYVHDGIKCKQQGWRGIMSLSESIQIARDIMIAKETKCNYHVCHISTKESVDLIREAKKTSNNITCEVTPHHLLLTEHDVVNSNYKMNPPLRSIEDRDALINGLIDGVIDVIATDHAPHTKSEKDLGIEKSPFGIVGLETAFALIYTKFVKENIVSLKQCIEWFTLNPAKILNIELSHLKKNSIADLVIIDLETKRKIDINKFYSKGKNTPFNGVECYGFPVMTIVDGEVVYDFANSYIKGE